MTDLEARWFEECSAAEVATALNLNRARVKWRSPAWVKRQWAKAQERGDLPPFARPAHGFPNGPRQIILRFMQVQRETKRPINAANKGVLECA